MRQRMRVKQSKGAVLLATLILNGVIAMLVLGTMSSKIVLRKAFQTYQFKQTENYELQSAFQRFIKAKAPNNWGCLYLTVPRYLYPPSHSRQPWCLIGTLYRYKIWDGGRHCCLKPSKQEVAHFYHVQFENKHALRLDATLVAAELNHECHCPKASGITTGILNMRQG